MELTRAPAIASHSSLRHFVPGFERNMSDEMVRRLAENGGVIQINFGSSFLTAEANAYSDRRGKAQERFREEHGVEARSAEDRAFRDEWSAANPFPFATVAVVADHVDRAVALAGVDHVGLGSDFDGVGPTLPTGLEDVSKYPALLARLLDRGYSREDVAKIAGGNLMRVWRDAEIVSRQLAGEPKPQSAVTAAPAADDLAATPPALD